MAIALEILAESDQSQSSGDDGGNSYNCWASHSYDIHEIGFIKIFFI
jgi:hypothetical protein